MRELAKLDPWMEGYLAYLRDVGRKSPRTVIDVRCTLRRVADAMATLRPGVPLWKLELRDYLQWMEHERSQGRTTSCLEKYVSHVRGLLDYTWRSGRCNRNVLDGMQLQDSAQRVPPRVLTIEEARRLIEACPQATARDRCDRLMLLLLYGCGLRTAELCALRIQDIDRARRELFIRHGKGDRERVIPIPQGVFTELLAYFSDRGAQRGSLFRTRGKRRPIASRQVCEAVEAASQRAGLTGGITPRTLRHTFATHLMDRGVDLAVIASLMGHRSPHETGVYLHTLPHRPKEAVEQLVRRRGGAQ